MRKVFIFFLGIVLTSIIVGIILIYNKKREQLEHIRLLPSISYLSISKEKINTNDIPDYSGYVINIFHPDCTVCQEEAKELYKNRINFQDKCFIMLSSDSLQNIETFALNYQLYDLDNFYLGHVKMDDLENYFKNYLIPSSYIYNQNKILLKRTRVLTSYTLEKIYKYNSQEHSE